MPSADTGSAEHHDRLRFVLRSAVALASTSVVTSGLGFLYWIVAARRFDATSVGMSSTAISAMNLIAPFTVLGFGTLLVSKLPTMRGGHAALVSTATLVSGAVGGALAVACAFALPDDFIGLPGIGHQFGITALFVAAVATQGMGMMLDNALLSSVGGGTQFKRNTIQAVAKLVLLTVFAVVIASRTGSIAIFGSWFLANVLSIVIVTILLMRRYHVSLRQALPTPSALRGLHFDAARHHFLNISLSIPFFAMPIVANAVLGPETAGHFYMAWSATGLLFYLPIALSTALFASGARGTGTFLKEFRFPLRYSLLICLAANIAILLLGGVFLKILGPDYEAQGRLPLSLIALGGFGLVIKDHHVALARVIGNVGREGILIAILSAGEVIGAAIGASRGGITGLSVGWLIAVAVEALVCGPLVWRSYRSHVPLEAE